MQMQGSLRGRGDDAAALLSSSTFLLLSSGALPPPIKSLRWYSMRPGGVCAGMGGGGWCGGVSFDRAMRLFWDVWMCVLGWIRAVPGVPASGEE